MTIKSGTPFGHRLLPNIVDSYARTNPNKLHSLTYVSGRLQDGITAVTYHDLAQAIHRATRWLIDTVRCKESCIAFMGNSDLRSIIFLLAGMKAGCKTLILNCYTAEHEMCDLLSEHQCQVVLYTDMSAHRVPSSALSIEVPSLKELLADVLISPVDYNEVYEDVKRNVIAIMLTSGSTGRPKSVPITHERLSVLDAAQAVGEHHGRPFLQYVGTRGSTLKYVALDLAYMGGIDVGVACPIFEGIPIVIGPGSITPHELLPEQFIPIMQHSGADSFLSYPSVIERISTDVKALSIMHRLKDVGYIGGPLLDSISKKLSAHTHVSPYIGSTEAGSFLTHKLPRHMIGYIALNSSKMGLTWSQVDDELYEPTFVRQLDATDYQGVFFSYPDRDTWPMGDLYSKHPTEPDVWRYEGRKDDTIILSHGDNVTPAAFEYELQDCCPAIESVILIGNARPALALLVQTAQKCSLMPKNDVLSLIWPAVEHLNASVGVLARVEKSRIILASNQRPFVRTKKGGISRKATTKLYEEEIEEVYINSGTDRY